MIGARMTYFGRTGYGGQSLVSDSRHVQPGDWFIASGARAAVHCVDAQQRGATVAVTDQQLATHLPTVRVRDAQWLAASCELTADNYPTVPLLAATGTDGKTSVTWLTWVALGAGAARMGTLGVHNGCDEQSLGHTTPPTAVIRQTLANLAATCPGLALELSSHAIDQRRIAGLPLQALVMTSIGRDHLDYHRSVGHYVATKLASLRHVVPGGHIIYDADTPRAAVIVHAARALGVTAIGIGWQRGDVRLGGGPGAWTMLSDEVDVVLRPPMPGRHNVWNAAAAVLLARCAGVEVDTAARRINAGPAVPGRLEQVAAQPLVFIDYAHTPQALALVIQSLREAYSAKKLIAVAGCGGDRDPGKRPLMGTALTGVDLAVLTSDNPRSEDPQHIIEAMRAGVPTGTACRVEVERGAAIAHALTAAGSDGVVVICGKGHEREQIIGDERRPWHDGEAVQRWLAGGQA